MWINQLGITIPTLFNNNLKIIIPFVVFTFLIALLVGLVINLVIIKFKELKHVNKVSGLAAVGLFGGLLGGACPSCFVGLFPAFLGLFGVTASLSSLPLFGLEIQIGSILLLLISVYFLTKNSVCEVK